SYRASEQKLRVELLSASSLLPLDSNAWCLLSRAARLGHASCSPCWTTTRWGPTTWKARPSCRCVRCPG
ncbi:unc-13 homolog D, partial [Homo sapiens]